MFAGLLLEIEFVALNNVIYPICKVDDIYRVGRVLAYVDELQISLQHSYRIVVCRLELLEVDVGESSDEVLAIFV